MRVVAGEAIRPGGADVLRGLLAETLLLPVHRELCVDAHALALRLLLPTLAGRGRERCAPPRRQPQALMPRAILRQRWSPEFAPARSESAGHACSLASMLCDLFEPCLRRGSSLKKTRLLSPRATSSVAA